MMLGNDYEKDTFLQTVSIQIGQYSSNHFQTPLGPSASIFQNAKKNIVKTSSADLGCSRLVGEF